MSRRLLILSLAAVAALLASCGGDEEASSTTSTSAASAEADSKPENDVYVGTIEVAPAVGGVLVRSIENGSPIAASGLLGGDVIVAVDGTPVETNAELAAAFNGLGQTYDGGDQFELTVARGKKEKTLTVTLAANVFLGTNLFDAPKGGGAEVKSVSKGSPAADAGIEAGDVIVAIDGQEVTDVEDLLQALATHAAGDEVEIEIERGSQEQTLTAKLDKRGYGQLKPRPGG